MGLLEKIRSYAWLQLFKMKPCFFCCSICYCCSVAYSQNCDQQIQGKIIDRDWGNPIPNAVVRIKTSVDSTQSETNGYFVLKDICKGNVVIEVSKTGYEFETLELNVVENMEIEIEMSHTVHELSQINIQDDMFKRESKTLLKWELNERSIDAYSHQNIAQALTSLSGVSMLKMGNEISKPIVHGMHSARVQIVSNGINLNDQQWGIDHAPSIDLNAYENVQLLKGAIGLKYGSSAPGGIIILSNRNIVQKDSIYGKIILSGTTNSRSGSFSSRIVKSFKNGGFMRLHGSYKGSGDFRAPEYTLSNTASRRHNVDFSVGQNKRDKKWEVRASTYGFESGILRAAHIGNLGDLLRAIKSSQPLYIEDFSYDIYAPKQSSNHLSLSGYYSWRLDSSKKIEFRYGYQRNNRKEYDVRRGGRSTKPAIDLQLTTHSFLGNYELTLLENWYLDTGISVNIQQNYSDPNTGIKRLIPDHSLIGVGGFVSASYSPNNYFDVELGGRIDYRGVNAKKYYALTRWKENGYDQKYSDIELFQTGSQLLVNPKFTFWDASLITGTSLEFTEDLALGLNYTYVERSPNAAELFSDGLHHSLASIEYGSLELEKENAHKVFLDLKGKIDRLSGVFTPFYSYINNFISINPTSLEVTVRGAFPVWLYSHVDAIFQGFDLGIDYRFTPNIEYRANISYVKAFEVGSREPLNNIPPFNIRHSIDVSSIKSDKWQVGISSEYVARQNRFPNNSFYVSVIEDGEINNELVSLSEPPRHYHLFNCDLRTKIFKKGDLDIESSLRISNIFNTQYRDYLNRLRYYTDEVGRDILIQMLITF